MKEYGIKQMKIRRMNKMKKFSIMWWLEVVGAVVFGILAVMMVTGDADMLSLGMVGILEALLVLDIVTSLMKVEDSEI